MQMNAEQVILSRQLPKTGCVTVSRAGDDGTYQAGWWKGLTVAGNKARFIAKTLDGDDVVIDRATGLMWAADGVELGCNNAGTLNFNDAIDYANALDFAGFTDWRLPNLNELFSIIDRSRINPCINVTFFPNTQTTYYWSSTYHATPPADFWPIIFTVGKLNPKVHTTLCCIRAVRGGV